MNTEYFITNVNTIKAENIHWNVISSSVSAGKTKFQIFRACPYVIGQNGKESPLIIETDKVFTFGVKETEKQEGEGFNYSIPLSVIDFKQPTTHQENFVKACEIISESGRQFLFNNQSDFKKDWILSDLRNVNILWRGKDSKRPTLYAKIPVVKGQIDCDFIQPILRKGQVLRKKVNPLLFRDVRCYVKAAVRIESIFIGSKVSFQTKIHELFVFPPPKKVSLLTLSPAEIEGLEEDEETSETEIEEQEETTAEQDEEKLDILKPVSTVEIIQDIQEPNVAGQDIQEIEEEEEKPKPRRGRKIHKQ